MLGQWVKPSPSLKTDAARRRARLLAILIIPFFASAVIGALVTPQPISTALWVLSALLIISFIMSRTRHVYYGAALAIIGASVPSFSTVIFLNEYTSQAVWNSMPWLAIPILLTALWLPVKHALIIFGMITGTSLALPYLVDGLTMQHLTSSLSMLSIALVLAAIGTWLTQKDQRNLEEKSDESLKQQAFLETILDNINDAVIVLDKQYNIISTNHIAEDQLGIISTQMDSQELGGLFPSIQKELKQFISQFKESQREKKQRTWHDIDFSTPRHQKKEVDLTVRLITINLEPFALFIIRDLTESKELAKMKNDFISTVSHELRTPLTSIQGALGLIHGLHKKKLDNDVNHLVDIASRNSTHLFKLVNDILDLSKLENRKQEFQLEPTNVKKVLETAIDENMPYINTRKVDVKLTTENVNHIVNADASGLRQVINNLLSNAIKFSPEGGAVEITVSKSANRIRVSFRDHGPGISEAFKSQIFQKFSREDSSNQRKQYGTGLGLTISKEIITQMGGSIGFESEKEKGAMFYFELPYNFT